jgi:hypothetical protein
MGLGCQATRPRSEENDHDSNPCVFSVGEILTEMDA